MNLHRNEGPDMCLGGPVDPQGPSTGQPSCVLHGHDPLGLLSAHAGFPGLAAALPLSGGRPREGANGHADHLKA